MRQPPTGTMTRRKRLTVPAFTVVLGSAEEATLRDTFAATDESREKSTSALRSLVRKGLVRRREVGAEWAGDTHFVHWITARGQLILEQLAEQERQEMLTPLERLAGVATEGE